MVAGRSSRSGRLDERCRTGSTGLLQCPFARHGFFVRQARRSGRSRGKADMAAILLRAQSPLATALRDCIRQNYGGCPCRPGCDDGKAENSTGPGLGFRADG
ncbi:hypothetical protein CF641_38540, partial [Burkholderia pseudomallei]